MNTKSLSKILEKDLGQASFGGYMRAMRTMKDMSQVEMAKFLGISRSGLCDIEKGRQHVSIEMAAKIAKKCEVSQELAVHYAIQDAIRRAGLKLQVTVRKAA